MFYSALSPADHLYSIDRKRIRVFEAMTCPVTRERGKFFSLLKEAVSGGGEGTPTAT